MALPADFIWTSPGTTRATTVPESLKIPMEMHRYVNIICAICRIEPACEDAINPGGSDIGAIRPICAKYRTTGRELRP